MSRPDSWFRLYNTLLDNPKVQRLSASLFKAWVNLLCLASRCGGKINPSDVDFALRTKEGVGLSWLKTLAAEELFHEDGSGMYVPHDWDTLQYKSDVSTDRVKRFRQRSTKQAETVSETPPEQSRPETEKNRTEEAASPIEVKALLSKATDRFNGKSTLPPHERKAVWQSKICREAQRIMPDADYQRFLIEWANGEKHAKATAERIDRSLKANAERRSA